MQRMVSFQLNRDRREVTVNPAKVLYICHYEHGASCIHFGKDCHVRVQGDVHEVAAKIEAALGEPNEPTTAAPRKPGDRVQVAGMN